MDINQSSDVNGVTANITVVCACLELCCSCWLFHSIVIDLLASWRQCCVTVIQPGAQKKSQITKPHITDTVDRQINRKILFVFCLLSAYHILYGAQTEIRHCPNLNGLLPLIYQLSFIKFLYQLFIENLSKATLQWHYYKWDLFSVRVNIFTNYFHW